jgi:DNA-binding transcriptional ArsR family regulator
MKPADAILSLSALAQASRLEIFRLLVKRGPEGYTPSDLIQKLDIPAPTLSFHLKELQHARLVESRRDGRFLYYRADFDRMNGLVAFLTENCCSLGNTGCEPACAPAAR